MNHTLSIAAGGALVAFHRVAIAARLRPRPDGWRRAAGLVLRGKNATFILSAFGLDVWSDSPRTGSPDDDDTRRRVAARLQGFLDGEPVMKVRIRRTASEHRAEPTDSPQYTLAFASWQEGPRRFIPPTEWGADAAAFPVGDGSTDVLVNFVVRVAPSGHADLWAQVNHVGADGVPVQEMLSRLQSAWGTIAVTYPSPEEFAPYATPRPAPGREGLATVQTFVNFAPLLAWRARENARLPQPMTFAAAVLWWLARQPGLRRSNGYVGSTVEVAPVQGLPRGVGVVVIRPASYADTPDGLARYARDFNTRVDRTRRRVSGSCRMLDAAALLSARSAERLLRHGLDQGTTAFGSLGLTLLKDAAVFGTPIADTGHPDGFLAIGSAALPTRSGERVACVTAKGPLEVIGAYSQMLAALARADA